MQNINVDELFDSIRFKQNESAFAALYRLLALKLCTFAQAFTGDPEPAKEIVNDVFLKLWLNRNNLSHILNLKVYLYTSVKNGCLNYLKRTASRRLREHNSSGTLYFQLNADPSELLISKELHAEIIKAINGLPPRCKLIFKMVKEDGLSSKEVADIIIADHREIPDFEISFSRGTWIVYIICFRIARVSSQLIVFNKLKNSRIIFRGINHDAANQNEGQSIS